jgi:hypothetical protein
LYPVSLFSEEQTCLSQGLHGLIVLKSTSKKPSTSSITLPDRKVDDRSVGEPIAPSLKAGECNMRLLVTSIVLASFCGIVCSQPADLLPVVIQAAYQQPRYYWRATAVGKTAELLTLFCRACSLGSSGRHDVPLVSVLRDTLGDSDPTNDRVLYVWLLTSSRPNVGQRLLSAVPFFYWRAGEGSQNVNVAPRIDLSTPAHPVISQVGRDILQWTVLDRMDGGIRASSRTYRRNELNYERLELEEVISYLRSASGLTDASAPTQRQLDTVLGRLELRKHLLGGLSKEGHAARLGEESAFDEERIRSRNWELLRQCAENTDLIVESLDVGGTAGQYEMLWFPLKQSPGPAGPLNSIWKLLNIKDPWHDQLLQQWKGAIFDRVLDENGALLPVGAAGVQKVALIPLGVYSLNYPKLPFLIIDFRDKAHLRRREVIQRAATEIATTALSVSRFANWYYYAGLQIYEFIEGRHGNPVDQAARLDCYSRFRVELALDQKLDPVLRKEMERRLESLRVNPLEGSPGNAVRTAGANYAALQIQAEEHGHLAQRLDDMRRSEIESFRATTKHRIADGLLHYGTFGLYEHGSKGDPENIARLDCYRRVQYELNFLDSVVKTGTTPEIAYTGSRLYASVAELSSLMTRVSSSNVRTHAASTLQRLNNLSRDARLQADCSLAIASFKYDAMHMGRSWGGSTSIPSIGGAASSTALTLK